MANKKVIDIKRQVFEFTENESNEIVGVLRNTLANYMHARGMIMGPERDKVQLLLQPVPEKPGLFKVLAVIEEAKEQQEHIIAKETPPTDSLN